MPRFGESQRSRAQTVQESSSPFPHSLGALPSCIEHLCTLSCRVLHMGRWEEDAMAVVSVLDFKLGVRMLRRYPGLSLIGGLALSVAIAIGSLVFQLVRDQLRPSLPLDEGDRVVRLENFDRGSGAPEPHALYDYQLWRGELKSVGQLGAARSTDRNLLLPDVPPRTVPVAEMTASAFALTRVPPLLGRPL